MATFFNQASITFKKYDKTNLSFTRSLYFILLVKQIETERNMDGKKAYTRGGHTETCGEPNSSLCQLLRARIRPQWRMKLRNVGKASKEELRKEAQEVNSPRPFASVGVGENKQTIIDLFYLISCWLEREGKWTVNRSDLFLKGV